jgi:hypothetical protein
MRECGPITKMELWLSSFPSLYLNLDGLLIQWKQNCVNKSSASTSERRRQLIYLPVTTTSQDVSIAIVIEIFSLEV